LDVGDVEEDVLRTVLGLNESKALGWVEPFYGASRHSGVPFITSTVHALSRGGSSFEGKRIPGSALDQSKESSPNQKNLTKRI
jgi:hypothetical protein